MTNTEERSLHKLLKGKPNVEDVQALIDKYPGAIKVKDDNGLLPLHYAVRFGASVEVIKPLIKEYPDATKEKDKKGSLLLHTAIEKGAPVDVIQLLIKVYPDAVKEKTKDGLLPLHCAARNQNSVVEVTQLLIKEYPYAVKEKDILGWLPLHYATDKFRMDVIQLLIEEYPDAVKEKDNYGSLPLHVAVTKGPSVAVEVIQLLIKEYPDALKENCDKGLPLHSAIERNVPDESVKLLIKGYPGAAKEKDKDEDLPLDIAIEKNRSRGVIKALLDEHPNAATERHPHFGTLPLHRAIRRELTDETILMLVNAYPQAAKEAMEDGRLPVEKYLERGASEHLILAFYKGEAEARLDGMLPLGIVLSNGSPDDDVLDVLEAYPGAASETFSTKSDVLILPLHVACEERRSKKVVDALLNAYPAAKIEQNPFENILRMHKCIVEDTGEGGYNSIAFVVAMLNNDYPDAARTKGKDGRLPLHIALQMNKDYECLRALLEHYPQAAKEEMEDGILPLHFAIEQKHSRAESLLLVYDAYPQAGKKKMQDGRLPIEALAETDAKYASKDKDLIRLIQRLLENDMPVSIEDGTAVEHNGSWTVCVSFKTEVATAAVRQVLSKSKDGSGFGKHIHALADVRDAEGRSALGLASKGPRDVIYEYLLFCGRYKLQIGPPDHRTKTSVVLRAQDLDEQADYGVIFDKADKDENGKLDKVEMKTIAGFIGLEPDIFLKGSNETTISKEEFVVTCKRQLGDGPREVVVKLMQSKDHWERECKARKDFDLSPKYVVSALPQIPSQTEFAKAVGSGDGGLDTIVKNFLDGNKPGNYALVMHAADRNLQQIFYQEQPKLHAVRDILKQVFEAVQHLHKQKLMHGDLKMVNIVRFRIDNKLRLIDLDASARIVPLGEDKKSFAGAKFSSAVLPPEMIERVKTEEEVEELKNYWAGEDIDFVKKVTPKPYKEGGIVKAHYIVKSFRTEKGMPVSRGLTYNLVRASESIDLWSLGILAFALLTGETLIPSTRDDDCASGAAMHLLYSWGTQPDVIRELLQKIHDDTARDLVEQLLQAKPEDRPSISYLLERHPFFHPPSLDVVKELGEIKTNLKDDRALLIKMDANIVEIKDLSNQGMAELARTREVLMKGIFEANDVCIPTAFVVLKKKLPPAEDSSDEEAKQKILDIVAKEDGTGFTMKGEYASATVTANGPEFHLEGELKEYSEQVKTGMKWVKRVKDIGLKVAAGEVGAAFDIIKDGISDLIEGEEMFLYLIDELTGEPVRAKGWPLIITTPSDLVPKLLPLMQVGMRAMCIYNGTVGLVRMFGFPAPKVPRAVAKGAQESIELLKQESSVQEFGVVHDEVQRGTEEEKSVRGASLRHFTDFLNKHDPGLKNGKGGDFAGMQRIGDPEDGIALWTALTDQNDIENALKERAKQREEEEMRQKEHEGKRAKQRLEEERMHNEHIQEATKKEIELEGGEGIKAEISEDERILPVCTTSIATAGEINLSVDAGSAMMHPEEISKLIKAAATAAVKEAYAASDSRNPLVTSEEIAELIRAANEAAAAAREAASASAGSTCCAIM